MKAVIPAAGLGTRLLPATKSMPKEMLPILDKPVIQYVVEEAVNAGIDDILMITGRGKRAIEDHFDRSFELEHYLARDGRTEILSTLRAVGGGARIHYVRQSEPLGLGHAVLCAERFVGDEPFAVLLGDDVLVDQEPATGRLWKAYEEQGASAVSVLRVARDKVSRYGIVAGEPVPGRTGVHRIRELVEKPKPERAPSDLAIMGRYVFSPSIFGYLRKTPPGLGGEIQLTDAMAALCRNEPLVAVEFHGERLDVGTVEGFLDANVRMALRRPDLAPHVQALLRRSVA